MREGSPFAKDAPPSFQYLSETEICSLVNRKKSPVVLELPHVFPVAEGGGNYWRDVRHIRQEFPARPSSARKRTHSRHTASPRKMP